MAGKTHLATLSAACQSGKSISTLCPSISDLPEACDVLEAEGWVWLPDIGYACSFPCGLMMATGLALKQGRASLWRVVDIKNEIVFKPIDFGDLFSAS